MLANATEFNGEVGEVNGDEGAHRDRERLARRLVLFAAWRSNGLADEVCKATSEAMLTQSELDGSHFDGILPPMW